MRLKLTVVGCQEIRTIPSGATVLPIFATKEGEEATDDYECWSKTLQDKILASVGKVIECDVEESQKGEYFHRKVTQIYEDGKGIAGAKGGGKGYGKSAAEIASIEAQTAFRGFCDIVAAGKAEMLERAAVTVWGLSKLTDNKNIIQKSAPAEQVEMKAPGNNKAQIDRIRQLCKDNKLNKAKAEARLKTMGLPTDVTKHTVAQLDAFEGDLIGMKKLPEIQPEDILF